METVIRLISPDVPHKVPVEKCKGHLTDPLGEYQEFAYWHGRPTGWFAKPRNDLFYIPCLDQQLSKFEVEAEVAQIFDLRI